MVTLCRMMTFRARGAALLAVALAVAVAPVGPAAVASPGLSGIDLGTLGGSYSTATAVNESGQVAGWSYTASGATHAFSWTSGGGMVDIGTLGGSYAVAYALNDTGTVVGQSTTAAGDAHAYTWDVVNGMTDLGTLGGPDSVATAVNASGSVIGYSDAVSGFPHAFVWDTVNGMTDLGTLGGTSSWSEGINAAGTVAGQAFTATGATHAFVWDTVNGMTDLGTLGGETSGASGINSAGQVAGVSDTVAGVGYANHAYLWTPGFGMADAGATMTSVAGVNDAGELGGSGPGYSNLTDAVRWSAAGGTTMLGVGSTTFGVGVSAEAINTSGQVAGGGVRGYVTDRFGGASYLVGPTSTDLTAVKDLNDAGQAVGYWADNPEPWFSGSGHAMLWTTSATRSLSVAGATVVEGDSGTRTVKATVTMSTPSPSTVTVHYTVVQTGYGPPGSFGTAGADFKQRLPGGTLTFKPLTATGFTRTSALISATVYGDVGTEGTEHFEVVLDTPTGPAILGPSQAPVTILDDDPGSGAEVSVGDASLWEGDSGTKNPVNIPITLRTAATSPMTVLVTVAGGSATAGSDYVTAVTRTVKFPIGASSRQISINVVPDASTEGDETISVTLSAPTAGLTIARGSGSITIQNDDA